MNGMEELWIIKEKDKKIARKAGVEMTGGGVNVKGQENKRK